jgi:catechol 2,3-dioxygenase-like lactoylglutathione lyase family enzyme
VQPALTHIALHVRNFDACVAFYRVYCGLQVIRTRGDSDSPVIWMAEPGKEDDFILVLIPGGPGTGQAPEDFSHLGFALPDRQAVETIAARADADNHLAWPPKDEPYPVGFYCGIYDPDGRVVEFSFGQPLGPGAKTSAHD